MIITVHAKARARENRIEWLDEDTAKIWVTAKPVNNQANEMFRSVLAKELGVAPSSITLIRGRTAGIKQFEIQKTTP